MLRSIVSLAHDLLSTEARDDGDRLRLGNVIELIVYESE